MRLCLTFWCVRCPRALSSCGVRRSRRKAGACVRDLFGGLVRWSSGRGGRVRGVEGERGRERVRITGGNGDGWGCDNGVRACVRALCVLVRSENCSHWLSIRARGGTFPCGTCIPRTMPECIVTSSEGDKARRGRERAGAWWRTSCRQVWGRRVERECSLYAVG